MPRSSKPSSLLVAITGTALFAVVIFGVAIASIVARQEHFSVGITIMLVVYALLVATGAYLGWRGFYAARGIMITAGLLHLAVGINLVTHGDLPQRFIAVAVIVVALVTVVSAVAPSTRLALTADDRPPQTDAQ